MNTNALNALIDFERRVRESERRKCQTTRRSSTFDNVMNVLINHRRKGTTTALVAIAKINPKTLIVTENYSVARQMSHDHGLKDNQVTSLGSLLNTICGRDTGPLLFDLPAVIMLMQTIMKEVENG